MDLITYRRFTEALTVWAAGEPDVVGLVALGSTAATTHAPDEWSDHDVWIIAIDDAPDRLRGNPAWLPDAERIVVFFAETEHGRTAIYDDGHLIEVGVFAPAEMHVARANAYRVLVDKADIADRMAAIAAATGEAVETSSPEVVWGRFLTQLVIGVSRAARGEDASASALVRGLAPANLLTLIRDHCAPVPSASLDDLDPHRRFERAFPEVGSRLSMAMRLTATEAASELLDIAEDVLRGRIDVYDDAAVAAVRRLIGRAMRRAG